MNAAASWRAHGGTAPIVEFDQQLDKLSLWVETWNHTQRCELIEKLLTCIDYEQYRFLWTVMQPALHRDFMYAAQLHYPTADFQPLSTHFSRKLRDRLKKNRKNNTFYRVQSAYCEFPKEILEKNLLPQLTDLRKLSLTTQMKRKERKNMSAAQLPKIGNQGADPSGTHGLYEAPEHLKTSPLIRFSEQPVRRHIQNESIVENEENSRASSLFHNLQRLPPNAVSILDWYNSWNDNQRNEFLHKLLLKLDERQHFFISNLLSIKQYKDFISLLPVHIVLKILSYLTPKELAKASRVCQTWKKMCERNEVWRTKCKQLNMPLSDYHENASKVNYKKLFKDYLHTSDNWTSGKYRELELKGHAHSVLCVSLDEKKSRLASGSMDRSIRIWDLKSGNCVSVLKGHSRGVWCLNFFTGWMMISGSYDTTIRVWNIQTGKCLKTLIGHDGPVWSICRRGNLLISGSQDRSIKVWDIRRCLLEQTLLGHQAAVFCVDLDKPGDFAFSSSADHTVRIWNLANGSCSKVIYASQTMAIMTVSYHQGYLACSFGETLCVYQIGENMESAKLVNVYEEHHKRIESVRLTMLGPAVEQGAMVSAGKDGLVKYWSLADQKSIQTFKASTEQITCVTFDKQRIVLAGKENKIKIFDFSPE